MILKDLLDITYEYQNIRLVDAKTLKLIASGKLIADIKNNSPELLTISVVHISAEQYDDKGVIRTRFIAYLNGDEYAEAKTSKRGKKANAV